MPVLRLDPSRQQVHASSIDLPCVRTDTSIEHPAHLVRRRKHQSIASHHILADSMLACRQVCFEVLAES